MGTDQFIIFNYVIEEAYTGDFLSVLAKTQFVQNGKTQFEKAKTQIENQKVLYIANFTPYNKI